MKAEITAIYEFDGFRLAAAKRLLTRSGGAPVPPHRGFSTRFCILSGTAARSSKNVALIYNCLGERKQTLRWLERGFREREPRMTFLKVEPKWNNLRSEPGFIELMRGMNFE